MEIGKSEITMNNKYTILQNIAYLSSLIILVLVFSWKGVGVFVALILFGFGMNLENDRRKL